MPKRKRRLSGVDELVISLSARGLTTYFPNEQAALKCVYMAIMSLDPTDTGQRRWSMRWKPALNAFDGRLSAGRK